MNKKEIDFDLTIKAFITEAICFFDDHIGCSTTMWEYNASTDAKALMQAIAKNPRAYFTDTSLQDVIEKIDRRAFTHGANNKAHIYQAFIRVLAALYAYYRGPAGNNKKLLLALKEWNYVLSKNSFKSLYYPLLSARAFAVRRVKQY